MKIKIDVEVCSKKNSRINNKEVMYSIYMVVTELNLVFKTIMLTSENKNKKKIVDTSCQIYGDTTPIEDSIEHYEEHAANMVKSYWSSKFDFMDIKKLEDFLRVNVVNNIKEDLFKNMKANLEKELLWSRFKSKEKLEKVLKKYGINGLDEVDKSGLVADYAYIGAIDSEGYGYVDIYYLKIPYGEDRILITGVEVSEE
jgi:hypothetical protein